MTANELVGIGLWLGVVLLLFLRSTPRRAVLVAFIGGWLFLPLVSVRVPGPLPDLSKELVTNFGTLVIALALDYRSFLALRPRWFDLPIAVWCAAPFVTALVNGTGAHEGISAVIANTVTWGIPYLFGRAYFYDAEGWRELAVGIFAGGLIYVPLCWIEILAGPQLAAWVYGYTPAAVETAVRFGGWRPIVFMQHGLMVAVWMTAATVCGYWLWRTRAQTHLWRIPAGVAVLLLVLTTVALKSVNAWLLMPLGIGLLEISTRQRAAWLAWGILGLLPLYLGIRASGIWSGQELVELTDTLLATKTKSVAYRFQSEVLITARARQQLLWGLGRMGILPPPGTADVATDSMWIIAFGRQGLIGLTAFLGIFYIPLIVFLRRLPAALWARAEYAPAAALAMVVLVYLLDNMANAMPNPVYMLAAGGLLTLARPVPAPETENPAAQATTPALV